MPSVCRPRQVLSVSSPLICVCEAQERRQTFCVRNWLGPLTAASLQVGELGAEVQERCVLAGDAGAGVAVLHHALAGSAAGGQPREARLVHLLGDLCLHFLRREEAR